MRWPSEKKHSPKNLPAVRYAYCPPPNERKNMSQEENKIKVDTYNGEQQQQPQKPAEPELPVVDNNKGETTESGCCGVCGG